MRPTALCFVAALASALVAGCSHRRAARAPRTGRTVLCATYPVWLFARGVARGRNALRLERLLPAQLGCPHDYVVTPDDMRRLERADALILNGVGLDDFARDAFERAHPGRPVLVATEGLRDKIPYRESSGDTRHGEGAAYNPHLFASPRQASRMVSAIASGLVRLDPDGGRTYEDNGRRLSAALTRLADDIQATVARLPNRAIVTQHDAFDYLARDAGLTIVAVIAVHPGEDPSASEVLKIVASARASRAGAVFTEPQYPPALGRTIAREAGIAYATLDPVATGPEDPAPEYYEQTMRGNLGTLARVLVGRQ